MKTYQKLPFFALSAAVIAMSSCSSEDPVSENDGEVITDVTLVFTELDDTGATVGSPFSFSASDSEGIEVGTSPEVDDVTLEAGKTYQMEIEVGNSIAGEDITEEILEESDEHQFFFLGSAFVGTTAPLTYSYDDEGGINLGVKGKIVVVASPALNTGTFRVVLRHDLNKDFEGTDNPSFENFVNAGGETDLDITFPLILN
jgi:hypothetical protein